jgi:hypothetical protein
MKLSITWRSLYIKIVIKMNLVNVQLFTLLAIAIAIKLKMTHIVTYLNYKKGFNKKLLSEEINKKTLNNH